jgi:hypothetical protein
MQGMILNAVTTTGKISLMEMKMGSYALTERFFASLSDPFVVVRTSLENEKNNFE